MIVEQDKMIADRERQPALQDLIVFYAAGDGANIEYFVVRFLGAVGFEWIHA